MSGLIRWTMRGVAALGLLAVVAGGVGYFLVARSLPEMSGTVRVTGIDREVEIVRDEYGVPRILASSEDDALFGLGYIHATDRMWQMDVARRKAQGRLSERFGADAERIDRMMRAFDLDGHASRSLSELEPETLGRLDAYAAGVNARIAQVGSPSRAAPEFLLFPGDLEPWTPADSLSVLKAMAFEISMGSLHKEVRRGIFSLALDPLQVRDLYPDYPAPGVAAVSMEPDEEASLEPKPATRAADRGVGRRKDRIVATGPSGLDAADPLARLGLGEPHLAGASNAWAVDGTRTAGKAPLLASDPHLSLTVPSYWHPAQISAPGLDIIGATLPGLPAIAFGRNADIAWGLTATQLDDIDVFIEKLYGDDPDRYVGPQGPLTFETRTETLEIAGSEPVALTLRRSRHGPVMPLDVARLGSVTPADHVPAVAWTALADDDTTIEALLDLNRADSAEAAVKIAERVIAPALNLIVADKSTIGIAVAGRAPLRRFTAPLQGRLPAPGWTDRSDWIGWVPQSSLPRLIEPETGAVANANNRIGNGRFPRHLSFDWDAPYRINRIEKLLRDRTVHSLESFKAMQADTVSGQARALLPLIGAPLWNGALEDEDRLVRQALDKLHFWNGDMGEHLAEPLIFSAWLEQLRPALVADELGALTDLYRGSRPLFIERVFKDIDGASRWCDDISTEDIEEACADVAATALRKALTDLSERYGEDMEQWRWGAAHLATHRNLTLEQISTKVFGASFGLGNLVNIVQETGGGDDTLDRGVLLHAGDNPFLNVHGAGFRGVYDFSDLDRSQFIVSTGASGHPLSDFYRNLAPVWRLGEYMTMSMDRRDFSPNALGTLRLLPSNADGE